MDLLLLQKKPCEFIWWESSFIVIFTMWEVNICWKDHTRMPYSHFRFSFNFFKFFFFKNSKHCECWEFAHEVCCYILYFLFIEAFWLNDWIFNHFGQLRLVLYNLLIKKANFNYINLSITISAKAVTSLVT